MDDRNFDEFMNFYFQSPSPERTAEAMQYYFSAALLTILTVLSQQRICLVA
jgi:hypothetical protein